MGKVSTKTKETQQAAKGTQQMDTKKRLETLAAQMLPLAKLEPNNGQIEGLPNNPRQIKGDKFEKLKRSIEDNPEMLGMRELLVYSYGKKYVIIGGNMRYEALKALGYSEAPCKIIESATAEQLRAYTIKDNSGFGEWDWDELANDWDDAELDEWGVDMPKELDEDEQKEAKEKFVDDWFINIECTGEQQCQELYDEFLKRGIICKIIH